MNFMYNIFFEYTVLNPENLLTPKKTDCAACYHTFVEAAGCECIENMNCDPFELISEACFECDVKNWIKLCKLD